MPIHKKGDKTDCNNYRGILLLPTTYKVLSNILLSRLIPYAEEVIGDHQCGFRRISSTTDRIFDIRQILEKNGNTMKQCVSSLYTSRKLIMLLGSTVQGLPCNVTFTQLVEKYLPFMQLEDSLPCSQKSAVLSPFYPVLTFH